MGTKQFISLQVYITVFFCCFIGEIGSQSFGELHRSIPVPQVTLKNGKQQYAFPWAGGMNSCQFGSIDMNIDGKNDLLVFDRTGNRKMTFINTGSENVISYAYSSEFEKYFPDFSDWVIVCDYDLDGKEDIFTYSPGYAGMKVYRNVSEYFPDFELVVYPYLTSYQGGGSTNILVTDADYPGIADVDDDGDIDILTFWGLGSFVQFHKNQSVEKYGIPDSLEYIRTENCWGRFAESSFSNLIILDTCNFDVEQSKITQSADKNCTLNRHTGSTFFIMDLDHDNDKDLVIGDTGFPNLIRLNNGGTNENAEMTSYDTIFPSVNPVNMYSMPACFNGDINNDGKNDLIVTPFDPNPFISENYKCCSLYLNTGEEDIPEYTLIKDAFLQEDMLDFGSGSYPVVYDYNNDGLMDILVSNFGYYDSSWYPGGFLTTSYTSSIALLKNTGSTYYPSFNLETLDYAELKKFGLLGLFPSFADIDHDGDKDMLIGNADGKLIYFENTAGPGQLPEYAQPDFNFQNIDIGDFSAPQLIDLDRDNRIDLVIGEKGGNLNFYKNTGTVYNPIFTFVTDSLGKVNVTDYNTSYYGYSVPCFFEKEPGKWELIIGSEQGKTFYFRNIEGNINGVFEESDSLAFIIDSLTFDIEKSYRTGCTIYDFDSDGYKDLITGNFSGGLKYYKSPSPPYVQDINPENIPVEKLFVFPNPVKQGSDVSFSEELKIYPVIIKVLDLSGKTLMEFEINNGPVGFNTGSLTPGFYICTFNWSEKNKKSNIYTKMAVSK